MNTSILGMNRTTGTRELETSPELSAKIARNDAVIRQYKACFGNDAAIALFVAFKDVIEMVGEMERQITVDRLQLEMDDPATTQGRLMDCVSELRGLGVEVAEPGDGRERML